MTLIFSISIFVLGVAAFSGGLWLNKSGPRVVVLAGGFLYGSGVILASLANHGLWWLYAGYGVIGGEGLGLGYIVPMAVLVKWFPDRRGLITGYCGRRVRGRRTCYGADRIRAHRACWSTLYIRISRNCITSGDSRWCFVHEESAGRMATTRLRSAQRIRSVLITTTLCLERLGPGNGGRFGSSCF